MPGCPGAGGAQFGSEIGLIQQAVPGLSWEDEVGEDDGPQAGGQEGPVGEGQQGPNLVLKEEGKARQVACQSAQRCLA